MSVPNTLAALKQALPAREYAAVESWASTFYPFQQEWVFDFRRFGANLKARQIGASHSFPGLFAVRALLGEDATMVSIREGEAKDLLGIAAQHLHVLHALGSEWARVISARADQLRLASGAVIKSTSSTAAGRGFSGNIFLDEFAYFDNQEKVWDAALAATTHGYMARVSSTPNGVGDTWHQLCQEIGHDNHARQDGWYVYRTTIEQAIADGMRIDLDECWDLARHDPRVFDQLYRCKFLDGDLQYIPTTLINEATVTDEPDQYAQTFGGIDIGESRDRTVLIVLQGDARNGYQVKHCESHARTDDELLQKLIAEAFGAHKCTRVAIDRTGMGSFPASKARRIHGPKLEPVQFTSQSKEEMAGRLYQAFADGNLRLPRKLPTQAEADGIRDDIASIRRIVTTAGNVRFDAPRTSKGHADRAWALMLALHCTNKAAVRSAYSDMKRRAG